MRVFCSVFRQNLSLLRKRYAHVSSLEEALGRILNGSEEDILSYSLLCTATNHIPSLCLLKCFFSLVVIAGFDHHVELCENVIEIYARFSCFEDACAVFHGIVHKNVTSWNAIIAICINHGHIVDVFLFFTRMIERGDVKPNKITFIKLLAAASQNACLIDSMLLHYFIVEQDLDSDLFVGNALLNLYNKCGSLTDTEGLFLLMSVRDVVSWTTMINAHAHHDDDDGKRAFQTFREMQCSGVKPNFITFINLLNVFKGPASLAKGKEVHALIQSNGLESDRVIGNSLISMYGRCACVEEAMSVFNKMREHDVVSWNAIVSAYAQQGYGKDAIEMFKRAYSKGLKPNKITFVSVLDAYSREKAADEGRLIHGMIVENEIKLDIVIETALLNMYGKCGSVIDAKCIFEKMLEKNVVSWTAIISSFSQHGYPTEALEVFGKMMTSKVRPNEVTYIAALDACTNPTFQKKGRLIHFSIVCCEVSLDTIVGNTLLSMYNNCGQLEDSIVLFKKLREPDVIAWTAMIGAYTQHHYGKDALICFAKMLECRVAPNAITFISVLDACAALSALADGKLVHYFIVQMGIFVDRDIGTAIVNMYGKCGSLREAYMIFLSVIDKDIIFWNVMLAAYAQQGYGKQALQLYRSMEEDKLIPNAFTFISLINACSHAGLVELGHHYFESMEAKYRISPSIEHYICMVDLLGRAGQLEAAEKFIKEMSIPPTGMVWMSYLSSCKLHNDLEKGKLAAEKLRKIEPQNLGAYVVLSNIHAATRKQSFSEGGKEIWFEEELNDENLNQNCQ